MTETLYISATCLKCQHNFDLTTSFVLDSNKKEFDSSSEATGQVYCPKCRFHQFLIKVLNREIPARDFDFELLQLKKEKSDAIIQLKSKNDKM